MKTLLLIFSSFIILSCTHNAQQSNSVSYTEIANGILPGAGAEGFSQSNRAITNTTDWHNLMDQMNSIHNITHTFTETNIDFNTYEVIAIFDEVRPIGDCTADITNIVETATEIRVTYHFSSPNGFAPYVITQPFHIVKI